MKMFMEINPRLFDECSHEYNERQNSAEHRERERQSRWEKLAAQARDRKNGIPAPAPAPSAASAEISVHLDDVDALTQDSQKRLNALKLDESSSSKDRRGVPTTVSSIDL